LIELREVVFEHAQCFERELHEPPIHRVQIGGDKRRFVHPTPAAYRTS
jgi:hypothetical protein